MTEEILSILNAGFVVTSPALARRLRRTPSSTSGMLTYLFKRGQISRARLIAGSRGRAGYVYYMPGKVHLQSHATI